MLNGNASSLPYFLILLMVILAISSVSMKTKPILRLELTK